jgi:hypothetical protein
MTTTSSFPTRSRLFPSELILLEPEQIESAKLELAKFEFAKLERTQLELNPGIGDRPTTESQQWQRYLNRLARFGFEQWLNDRLPEPPVTRLVQSSPFLDLGSPMDSICYLEVNGFKCCLMAVEHVLDEVVSIPQLALDEPELTAHFYVLHEVSEEQNSVILRGFCRYDDLIRLRAQCPPQDGCYPIPLALLDAELNHLLVYCLVLQPSAIALPISAISQSLSTSKRLDSTLLSTGQPSIALTDSIGANTAMPNTITQLSQWLQGNVDEYWQAIDQFIHPETSLAFNTRSVGSGVKRGKLINLGVQLGQQAVALLVNVASESEDKLGVSVQLHPTGDSRYLTPDLKLSLRSQSGKMLQEAVSRSQDNYIQLKPFRGTPKTRFSIEIHLGTAKVEESFEL